MRSLRSRPVKDIAVAILFVGVTCLLVLSGIFAYRSYITSPPYVDEEQFPVKGIDISRHNGDVDFDKVADSGIKFVFIKASEGVNHRDSLFRKNLAEARKAGLKTGAYHFFRFDRNGIEQAQNFLRAVGRQPLDLGLAIDVEKAGNPDNNPKEKVKEELTSMVEYMNLLGHRVTIYTNVDGYYDYIEEVLPGCQLWICGFHSNPINAEWTFWQYDHHGKIAGIKGDVDLNVFCGSEKEWERYLQGDVWPYDGPGKTSK